MRLFKYFLVLFFVCSSAWSLPAVKVAPLSFSLDSVSVSQVLRIVYGEVVMTSYVLDPVVVADQRLVSFRWDSSKGDIRSFMVSFLDSLGYVINTRSGVDFVRVKEDKKDIQPEKEVFVYRPKFRDGSYLVDMLTPLFKGSFSARRGISLPESAKQDLKAVNPNSAASMIDRKADTLIFSGSDLEIGKLKKLLDQVDMVGAQVLVRGALYEVQTSSGDGSAFSLAASVLSGKFGITLGSGGAVLANSVALKTTGPVSIDAVLSALATDSRFKVVSSPSLRVRDGSTAKLVVGQEVPVLGALSFPQGGGQAVQSIEYRSSGVIFDLTPQIRDSVVDLQVSQQVSNFINTTTGVNGSPTLTKRELSTAVSMSDGDVIVLGGLNENKESAASSGLSFLPAVFHSTSKDQSNSEILLILQVTRL